MDLLIPNDTHKKIVLENLSKEELIKKCTHLVQLAHKAKQSKVTLQEENNKLKEQLSDAASKYSDPVSQELIDSLTQQKLILVTNNEELKTRNEGLLNNVHLLQTELRDYHEKFALCDNENTSYKRQINRLTDENEQLISDLDSLEKQIFKLKEIGASQQQQLIELERARNEETEHTTSELQKMLSVSLGELEKIKTENNHLKEKIENLELNLKEKDKNILVISEELSSSKDLIPKNTTQLEHFKNKEGASNSQAKDNKIKELEEMNSKLKHKIKFYHSKIVKFANIAKDLRMSKNEILVLFNSYIDQVKDWKEQLNVGEKNIIKYLNTIVQENEMLKEKLAQLKSEENTPQLKEYRDNELKILTSKYDQERLYWEKKEQDSKETIGTYISEMKIMKDQYENEKIHWEQEIKDAKENIESLSRENQELRQNITNANIFLEAKLKLEEENTLLNNKLEELVNLKNQLLTTSEKNLNEHILKLAVTEKTVKEQDNEIKLLRKENITISKVKEDLILELDTLNSQKKVLKEQGDNFQVENEQTISDLQNQVRSFQELEKMSSEEIKYLADENKVLISKNESLQDRLHQFESSLQNRMDSFSQTKEVPCNTAEFEEQITNLKRENSELLSEMNEMNQAIKERGENISKLEAHCEEVLKKLQVYETQANKNIDNLSEKEKIIENLTREIEELKYRCKTDSLEENKKYSNEIESLKGEIEVLKEKLSTNLECSYADDGMSTSTISRTEELNRLKDLEGSWEERYGKLRTLAVKLKSKVRELSQTVTQQQSENEENQKKLASNIKNIQNLQNQCDNLEDELDRSKNECKQLQNQLSGAAIDISKDKQSLAETEEIIARLKIDLDNNTREKQETEIWKKQVGAKIQTLRKELEANNVLKKEYETKIAALNSSLESKDVALKAEIESHKHTKNLLDQSNNDRKKHSVLSLEMQDYERGAKESVKKLEKQQEEINKLKNQLENQKTTINALREQNKLLEDKLQSEEHNLSTLTLDLSNYKKQISNLENEISQKIDKIQTLTHQLETSRSETEELSTELSKVISEHQKVNNNLKMERDQLSNENLRLQQSLREAQDNLKLNKDELNVIQREYDGYKVRAQSVLRQNQSRDVGLEEKLSEEVASLVAQNSVLTNQISEYKKNMELLEKTNSKLTTEIKDYIQKLKELQEDYEEIKIQFADLSTKHEKTVSENTETLRNLKVHADTLSQCYRQQLSDQESRHSREILELQSRLDKAPTPTETSPVLLTMPRGEGEGSESIDSNSSSNLHPVPLERLLGTDSEQEIDRMKKKLQEQESKLTHLTSLLSDTEQDLVKHVQMNKLLKEEIRRQQRSEEREKHAENLEYLKNVVFKFVTLNSGDERTRLVPVLNTILKLSPEESKQLNCVASGGVNALKGWSSYLPAWSSPNKSQ